MSAREIVHRIDDPFHVVALDRRPDVDVADLRDAEPVQRRRQAGDRDVDAPDPGPPAGVDEAHEGEERGEDRHRERAVAPEPVERGRCHDRAAHRRAGEQPDIAGDGQDEERRKRSDREQGGPGERLRDRPALEPREHPTGITIAEPISHSAVAAIANASDGISGRRRQPT